MNIEALVVILLFGLLKWERDLQSTKIKNNGMMIAAKPKKKKIEFAGLWTMGSQIYKKKDKHLLM